MRRIHARWWKVVAAVQAGTLAGSSAWKALFISGWLIVATLEVRE